MGPPNKREKTRGPLSSQKRPPVHLWLILSSRFEGMVGTGPAAHCDPAIQKLKNRATWKESMRQVSFSPS